MRMVLDPGKERRSINFIDHIVYSHVQDRQGNPVDLELSLMVQNGNSEMRLASGRDDEVSTGRQPLIVWINGAGWHDVPKNMMAAEMQFLAEAGFAVAFIHYRGTELAGWPAQLIDCKTAVRFLRAHADQYGIDPNRVATMGRSAGGHLSAWMAMKSAISPCTCSTSRWNSRAETRRAPLPRMISCSSPSELATRTRRFLPSRPVNFSI